MQNENEKWSDRFYIGDKMNAGLMKKNHNSF